MRETGGLELASTITFVLQANRLTNCASHPKLFLTNSQVLWTIFRSLFEDTKVTTKFPKRHFCNTSCIKMNTLFAIFNNKGLGNFKVRPTHTMLKRMDTS